MRWLGCGSGVRAAAVTEGAAGRAVLEHAGEFPRVCLFVCLLADARIEEGCGGASSHLHGAPAASLGNLISEYFGAMRGYGMLTDAADPGGWHFWAGCRIKRERLQVK